MAEQMDSQQVNYHEHSGCIELVRYLPASDEERKSPGYIPKLELNERALEILSERFESPISIIAFVGKVGVGKSKLASLVVETLHQSPSDPPLGPFRSGKDGRRITKGIWMWSEPLKHPDENEKGSVLILDCEGIGELDVRSGSNLFLFCMLMSTTFAVVLRAGRVDRFLYEDLYYALSRFKDMRTPYLLPNVCLVAMDTLVFCDTDQNGDDILISKEQWLNKIFTNTSDTLSEHDNQLIQLRYDCITGLLPKIDAVNIDDLPQQLKNNNRQLDIYHLLRDKSSNEFYTSLQTVIQQLLSTGGKRILGDQNPSLFIRPYELIALMNDLINVLNQNQTANTDSLINQILLTRFKNEIVKEQIAQFQQDLLGYANNIFGKVINENQISDAITLTDQEFQNQCDSFIKQYLNLMIRLVRHQIYALDQKLADEYLDNNQQQEALLQLPKIIQEQLKIIETQMNQYTQTEFVIKQLRENLVINNLVRQQQEQRAFLKEITKVLEKKRDIVFREKRINNSLNPKYAKTVRVGLAPCGHCSREGGAVNYSHAKRHCFSGRNSNYYYYNQQDDLMVCAGCRQVVKIREEQVECRTCEKIRKVTRYFKYNE